MKIGIIGAGLNGLVSALLLKKFGHDVEVFERSIEPRDSGTGIYVWPQGVQILKFIMNSGHFMAQGQAIKYLVTNNQRGQEVHRQSVNMPGLDFPAPAIMFERQQLFQLLREALGDDVIHYGAACTHVINRDDKAVIEINHSELEEFDLVIGADGISSKVREFVTHQQPYYTGVMASRGVLQFHSANLEADACQIYAHKNARLVTYPLNNDTNYRYWFIAYKHDLNDKALNKEELVTRLAGLPTELLEMVSRTQEKDMLTNPLKAMNPEKPWYKGRCVLLGDSIHGMLPTLGYGLTLGLENCFMLAQAINGNCFDDIALALKRYESRVSVRSQKMLNVMEELTDLFYFQDDAVENADQLKKVMAEFYSLAETTAF